MFINAPFAIQSSLKKSNNKAVSQVASARKKHADASGKRVDLKNKQPTWKFSRGTNV